ncbi:phosphopantetheine-binding protein, partial [Streptomyces boncukensis]
GLAGRVAALPPDEQHALLLDLVRTHAADVLGHTDSGAVPVDRGFLDIGFDSLTISELAERLADATGVYLTSPHVFDHPSPDELAAHLLDELGPREAAAPDSVISDLPRVERALTAIAHGEDESVRAELRTRLRSVLARLGGPSPNGSGAPAANGAGTAEWLATAGTDELFAFIDQDLGRGSDVS